MAADGLHTVLEFRVSTLETMVGEVRAAIKSIDISLQALTRLEQRHAETRDGLARAFAAIHDQEERLRRVESDMPTVRMVRNWVIAGVIGGLGMGMVATYTIVADNHEFRVSSKALAEQPK